MTSLSACCTEHGLAKSSVHRKCKELNIDTSQGLSEFDVAELLDVYGKSTNEPKSVEVAAIEVYSPSAITTAIGAEHHELAFQNDETFMKNAQALFGHRTDMLVNMAYAEGFRAKTATTAAYNEGFMGGELA